MLVAEALRDLSQEGRRDVVGYVDAECGIRFPVLRYLKQAGLEAGLVTRPMTELVRSTLMGIAALDHEAGTESDGEPASILPADIHPDDAEGIGLHIATYARAFLRIALPEALEDLENRGRLEPVKEMAIANAQAVDLRGIGALGDEPAAPDITLVGLWNFIGVLQATRFRKKRGEDLLWDVAAAAFGLGPAALSESGQSWSNQRLADFMNRDPSVPRPVDAPAWTAKMVDVLRPRFATVQREILTRGRPIGLRAAND